MEQKRMGNRKNFITCENEGLSLVEVIIALAIMSIVLLMALQMVLNGTRMFTRTSESVDVQTEAQILEGQLNNLIVDAECAVYAIESSDGDPVTDEASGFSADAYIKVFNNSIAYYIAWDKESAKVYYMQKDVTDGNVDPLTEAEKSSLENWYLMGEGVVAFSPDMTNLNQRLVKITLRVEKGEHVHYETIQNIFLRNNVLESNDLDEIYSDEETAWGETITDVIVSPSSVVLNKGESVSFSCMVKSGGSTAASQNVTWTVSGATSSETTITSTGSNTASLEIAADEDAQVITVIATADGTSVSGQASVVIPTIEQVIVTTSDATPPAGGRGYFTAQVIGSNLNSGAREVVWSVESAAAGVSITNEGVLIIPADAIVGTPITVRATARVTTTGGDAHVVAGTCSVTVGEAGSGGTGIVATAGDTTIKRGGNVQLVSRDGRTMTWEIVDYGGLGSNKVSIDQSGRVYTEGDIDYTKDYTIKVKATPVGGTSDDAIIQEFTLPKVSIVLNPDSDPDFNTISPGEIIRIPYTLEGIASSGMELSVSSNPSFSSQSGTFMYCTGSELVIIAGSNINTSQFTVTVSLIDNASVSSTIVLNVTASK